MIFITFFLFCDPLILLGLTIKMDDNLFVFWQIVLRSFVSYIVSDIAEMHCNF